MKKIFKYILYAIVLLFALIGMLFTAVFIGMRFGIFNVQGSSLGRNAFFSEATAGTATATDTSVAEPCPTNAPACSWTTTPEWAVVNAGLTKDASVIDTVAGETGVSARMIAAAAVPEQMRYFTSDREDFKDLFEPLKILGSLSQFSLGVSGIKQETANDIEKYAADPTSPFYPGDGMSALVAYAPGADHDAELYDRLTNTSDHYYSYLYTALYIKEVEAQWKNAGYDISKNPEAVTTLFNIGFANSIPKADPAAGGAPITVTSGVTYAYGELGGDFYHSAELTDIFPQ